MNKYILIIAMLVASVSVSAVADERPRKGKDVFLLAKMKMIQQELDLTEEQTNEFMPVYREYNDAMKQIFESHRKRVKEKDKDSMQEALRLVDERIDLQIEMLKKQRGFYSRFSKILTPRQLIQFEDAERKIQFEIMRRHDQHRKKGGKARGRNRMHDD